MANALQMLTNKLAERFEVGTNEQELVAMLKNTAFKQSGKKYKDNTGQWRESAPAPVTDDQMMALLIISNQYGLNPWTKEIYAFPDKSNGITPIVGVDGWARIINDHPQFDGIEFNQDEEKCTCSIYRKDRSRPISITEYMSECKRDIDGPWRTHPKRMLRHKALIQCARLAFGFTGIYDQDEAERIVENKEPIDVTPKPVTIEGQAVELATEEQKQQILQILETTGTPFDKVAAFVGKNNLDEFPKDAAETVIKKLNKTKQEQQQQRKQEEELGEAIAL